MEARLGQRDVQLDDVRGGGAAQVGPAARRHDGLAECQPASGVRVARSDKDGGCNCQCQLQAKWDEEGGQKMAYAHGGKPLPQSTNASMEGMNRIIYSLGLVAEVP